MSAVVVGCFDARTGGQGKDEWHAPIACIRERAMEKSERGEAAMVRSSPEVVVSVMAISRNWDVCYDFWSHGITTRKPAVESSLATILTLALPRAHHASHFSCQYSGAMKSAQNSAELSRCGATSRGTVPAAMMRPLTGLCL